MPNEDTLRQLREAKSRFGQELLAHPDIHGVGIGYQRREGRKTQTLSLVVHVYKKRLLEEVEESRRIPSGLSFFSQKENRTITVPVDVREVMPPEPEVACPSCSTNFEARVRPVPGGFSIGLEGVAGGTLGGYVWDQSNNQIVFLSNEHVLGSTSGSTVIQPSAFDGGSSPADDFGAVVRAGTFDAAIGEANDADDESLEIECGGQAVYEITDAILDMEVTKVGQTTGMTCGVVDLINYDSGHYGSHNDLWIDGDGSDFSQGGDSGSLYLELNHPEGQAWRRVVGLHWGGSGNDGVGHPIRAIFTDLNLTTVCAGVLNTLVEAISEAEEVEMPELTSATSIRRAQCYPGPIVRHGQRVKFYHGIARDFEKRIQGNRTGANFLKVLRLHRVDVVNMLLDGDGWRATVDALAPILQGKVTTDEILEHRFTAADLERFSRTIVVAARLRPDIKPLLDIGQKLLAKAEGNTLAALMGLAHTKA